MVRGLDIFKSYFGKFPRNYVVIGGTACDIIISSSGFKPRATNPVRIILINRIIKVYKLLLLSLFLTYGKT